MTESVVQCFRLALTLLSLLPLSSAAPSADLPSLQHIQYAPDLFKEYDLVEVVRLVYNKAPEVVEEALMDFGDCLWPQADEQEQFSDVPQIEVCNRTIEISSCSFCKVFVGILTAAARSDRKGEHFKNATERFIGFCEKISGPLGINGTVFCRGTLQHQMEQVYGILKNKNNTVEEMCRFLNLCLPPPLEKPVRAKQSADLNQKPKTEPRTLGSRAGPAPPENSLVVVQLTDVHVEPNYAPQSKVVCDLPVCCDPVWGSGPARSYGEYQCNIPMATVQLFLEKAKTFNPDVILFSGDVPPHSTWDEEAATQFKCSETLVETLTTSLPGYKVYPNIGNHEGYPTNQFSVRHLNYTPAFLDVFVTNWTQLADFSEEDQENIRTGGFYSKHLMEGLRLISFNTNYMYTFNFFNVENHKNFSTENILKPTIYHSEYHNMTTFVEEELFKAESINEKVILMGHHPPGGSDYIVNGSRWYRDLVLQYNETIVLQPSGHTHYDEFRMIYDDEGNPSSVALVAPSMSSGGTRNPSMRIFYLHNETKELLDYDHYYLNLGPIIYKNSKAKADELIELLYSAKSYYGMDDLSPASWDQLLQSFEENSTMLLSHRKNYQGGAELGSCETRCQHNYICRMRNVNYDEYKDCAMTLSDIDWGQITSPSITITRPPTTPPSSINSSPPKHSLTIVTLFLSAVTCILSFL